MIISTVKSVCPCVRPFPFPFPCVRKLTPVFAVVSQNVTNKSFLVRVKSEKYSFWVTLRSLGSMRQGEAEIHALQYWARRSQAAYIKTHFSVTSPLQPCRSQAVVSISTPRMYLLSGYFLVIP